MHKLLADFFKYVAPCLDVFLYCSHFFCKICFYVQLGRGVPNGFSGCSVSANLSEFFTTHFLQIVVEVKASGPPHILKLWLEVKKGMLPVKYFCSNKASLCRLNFMEIVR